jgi:hypothetical protein
MINDRSYEKSELSRTDGRGEKSFKGETRKKSLEQSAESSCKWCYIIIVVKVVQTGANARKCLRPVAARVVVSSRGVGPGERRGRDAVAGLLSPLLKDDGDDVDVLVRLEVGVELLVGRFAEHTLGSLRGEEDLVCCGG